MLMSTAHQPPQCGWGNDDLCCVFIDIQPVLLTVPQAVYHLVMTAARYGYPGSSQLVKEVLLPSKQDA